MKLIFRTTPILIFAILMATLALYWPGLTGRFLFDDFAHIVLNDDIRSLASWSDVLRVITSGNAGPGGRPLPLLTFSLQIISTGLDPYYFKLVNVVIHLINIVLLFILASYLLKHSDIKEKVSILPRWALAFPLVCCAWWAFHPVAITSILYTVQRMTSMSALFSLLALILYFHFRRKTFNKEISNSAAFGNLLVFTTLSYFCKENGILTLAYAYLIEAFVLKWQGLPFVRRYPPTGISVSMLLLAVLAAAIYLNIHPVWGGYDNRPFTLTERVLTETRVLWFYIGQILLPHSTDLSLYHDDYPLSTSLTTPFTTLIAVVGHGMVGLGMFQLRKKMPMVVFGVAWFYVGHSLESSFFPLELVFEHRNYMPMMGLLFALATLPFYMPHIFKRYSALYIIYGVLIFGCLIVTAGRAIVWGRLDYALLEAERKPLSARANYDAGLTVMDVIERNPSLTPKYADEAKRYYARSIAAANSTATPGYMGSYTGMFSLHVLLKEKVPEELVQLLENKLRHAPLHPVTTMNLVKIHELQYPINPYFTLDDGERIYKAILENPKSKGVIASNTMVAYALLWATRGSPEKELAYYAQAAEMSPDRHEARIIYIRALIKHKKIEIAKKQLAILQQDNGALKFKDQIEEMATLLVTPY